jgi:hypothetical protein
MPSSEIPAKSKSFEEIVLWIVVGLSLALGVAWATYPKDLSSRSARAALASSSSKVGRVLGLFAHAGVFFPRLYDRRVLPLADTLQPQIRPRQLQDSVEALPIA